MLLNSWRASSKLSVCFWYWIRVIQKVLLYCYAIIILLLCCYYTIIQYHYTLFFYSLFYIDIQCLFGNLQ